jgi:hydrogenase maturation factor
MNLISGRVVEIFMDNGVRKGKVQVGKAFTNVVLTFVTEARVGDLLLIDSGVAIGIFSEPQSKETHHVSGHSG